MTKIVVIKVSQPYTQIGLSGHALPGLRRDYAAEVLGKKFKNTNKATIKSVIRAAVYRSGDHSKITFKFVQE